MAYSVWPHVMSGICGVSDNDKICQKPKNVKNICTEHYKKSIVQHPLKETYRNMKYRCYSPKRPDYKNYGGRGIKMHESWLGKDGFKNFCKDVGERPDGCTLDRIDNNGDYTPNNCRWSTKHVQNANRRVTKTKAGVWKDVNRNSWRTSLCVNKKVVFRKTFKKYSDAVEARKEAEMKYLGYYV